MVHWSPGLNCSFCHCGKDVRDFEDRIALGGGEAEIGEGIVRFELHPHRFPIVELLAVDLKNGDLFRLWHASPLVRLGMRHRLLIGMADRLGFADRLDRAGDRFAADHLDVAGGDQLAHAFAEIGIGSSR